MKIRPLKLKGTYEIALNPHQDERGYFMRTYDESIFNQYGMTNNWVQENQSLSQQKGIIRGLHFQKPPHAETKLIRAVIGVIFDVFVDLRKNSETYGQWDSIELSGDNYKAVYVPGGFAHGFCTLSESSLVFYKVDAPYNQKSEGGLRWNDPELGIEWPVSSPLISEKDSKWGDFQVFCTPFL